MHPLLKRLAWIGFAVVFYNAGQAFTVLVLEPDNFAGGLDWIWLIAFPLLLPLFFIINRRLCACTSDEKTSMHSNSEMDNNNKIHYTGQMP